MNKGHDPFITFHEIGIHKIPVVVAVKIHLAQNQVGAVVWHGPQQRQLLSQQQNPGTGDAVLPSFRIGLVKLGALQQFKFVQVLPGMVFPTQGGDLAASGNQVAIQVIKPQVGEHHILAVGDLLALVKLCHLGGVISDIQVAVFVAVVNATVAAMHLRAFRDIDTEQWFAANRDFIHRQIGGRGYFLWIVDACDKVFPDLRRRIRLDALNNPVILNTEKQGAAMPVQKGANGFVDIPIELVPAGFEFEIEPFALANQFKDFGLGCFHSRFLFQYDTDFVRALALGDELSHTRRHAEKLEQRFERGQAPFLGLLQVLEADQFIDHQQQAQGVLLEVLVEKYLEIIQHHG